MRKLMVSFLLLVYFGFIGCITTVCAQEIRVSSPQLLIEAIGPDRTIVLEQGEYILADAAGIETDYVSWQNFSDGPAPTISNVDDLTIRGEFGTSIIGEPKAASVLTFE